MKKIVFLVVCSLLLGSLVCFVGCGSSSSDITDAAFAQSGTRAPAVRWEYKIVDTVRLGGEEKELTFNQLGSEGWEFICYNGNTYDAIFKRRLP